MSALTMKQDRQITKRQAQRRENFQQSLRLTCLERALAIPGC